MKDALVKSLYHTMQVSLVPWVTTTPQLCALSNATLFQCPASCNFRGLCRGGACECFLGWGGDSCELEVLSQPYLSAEAGDIGSLRFSLGGGKADDGLRQCRANIRESVRIYGVVVDPTACVCM